MNFNRPIFALDIETSSLDLNNNQYALEAFRVKQNKAKIDSIAISGPDEYKRNIIDPDKQDCMDILEFLKNKYVFCHNAIFDISWLMAYTSFDACKDINWSDTMLIAKWLLNSQKTQYGEGTEGKFSYSLVNVANYFLEPSKMLDDFTTMKKEGDTYQAGENLEYWQERGILDAKITKLLAIKLMELLPLTQFNGVMIEQACLKYVARANLMGIPIDSEKINSLEPKINSASKKLANILNIDVSMVRSSKQLSHYLFNVQGYKGINRTKTGWSTAAGDLLMIAINNPGPKGEAIRRILDIKQLQTLKSKYIKGFNAAIDYNQENKIYPQAKMFSTYTGRFTYSTRTLNKDKFKFSIATHQLPRKGPTKSCLNPIEDHWILRCDGAQQELRLIAIIAKEQNLIQEFNNGIDVHSSMSAFISNQHYDDFIEKLKIKDPATVNYRYAGKLLNLSCQYRIGATALKRKFFETYEIIISMLQSKEYLSFYKRRYPGVVQYWNDIVIKSRSLGYTNTFADRRYGLSQWANNQWSTESSAINTPIQGSAADHKELTLMLISKQYPEIKFFLDIHDELCFYVPKNLELVKDIANTIANLTDEYKKYWNIDLPIQLPFDALLCKTNFKEGINL